jgi:glycosyltransferase involved in cell wall biosynthesis
VPIGTGFGEAAHCSASARPAGLPAPGSYVLFVSTVEVRKNHALLFSVWRKLEDEVRAGVRDAASVPILVFAGRVGWLVSDLLGQLENTHWLHGKVRLIPDPSDAELRALYRGCLFTAFPSWFEGWGLPVSESLAFGKPCLASCATALPEAGGDLCRYFDPGDVASAHQAIAALLDTPGALAAWEDRVRREFRPVPWSATAAAVLEATGP